MRFLITGTAGFIGFHVAKRLLDDGHEVFGLDGMTPYYDLRLKEARNALLSAYPAYRFEELRLEEAERLATYVTKARPEVIFHFAAQARRPLLDRAAAVLYRFESGGQFQPDRVGPSGGPEAFSDGVDQFRLWRQSDHALQGKRDG